MKFTLKRHRDSKRGWPGHLFGGHVRTSTLVLIVAFFAVSWVYDTYKPPPEPPQAPAPQVVPPGFLPDPSYTWVPRTRVQKQPRSTTQTTTPTPTPETTTTTRPEPPPFPFPFPLPPPFGPPPPPTPSPPESTPSAPDTLAPSTPRPEPAPPKPTPPR